MALGRHPVPVASVAVLVAAGLMASAPARANDASFEGGASGVFAVKETRVRMARERVSIRFLPRGEGKPRDEAPWRAECEFTFENRADRPVTVQMGHPDWRRFGELADQGPQWTLREFAAEVDGKPVEATHSVVTAAPGARKKLLAGRFEAAYTWPVTLPARGSVTVRNTYRFGGFDSNGPFLACAGDPPAPAARRAFWFKARPGPAGTDFANGTCQAIPYVVTTARTWAGPIGEAEIEMDLPADVPPHLVVPAPAASSIAGGRVRWHFRNWTPRADVVLLVTRPIPGERAALPAIETLPQARAYATFARGNHVDADTMRGLRAWTRAALERRYDDPAVAGFAKRFPWYLEGDPAPRADPGAVRAILKALGEPAE